MTQLIEKHGIKIQVATLVAVIIFAVTASYNIGQLKAITDARIGSLESAVMEVKSRTDDCEIKSNTTEVELAKINTKLASIESMLVELRDGHKLVSRETMAGL